MKVNMKKSMNDVMMSAVRKTWSINPVSRIVESKKKYNRKDKSWKKEF